MKITTSIRVILLAGSLVLQPALAARSEPLLTSPVAEVFGKAPSIVQPKLSPDGTQVLHLGPDSSGTLVAYIRDLGSNNIVSPIPADIVDGYDIAWCEWANDTRVLCQRLQRDTDLIARDEAAFFDIFAVNVDGTDPLHWLDICGDATGFRQGPAIDWLPEDPDHIMTICNTVTEQLAADEGEGEEEGEEGEDSGGGEETATLELRNGVARRINIHTGLAVDAPGATGGNIYQAYLDGRGNTRIYDSGYAWYAQIGGREDWIQIFEYRDSDADLMLNYRPRMGFVGFGADPNEFFGVVENRGSSLLFTADIDNNTSVRELLKFKTGTMPQAMTLGKFDRVATFVHYNGGEQFRIVDDRVAEVHAAVSLLLPGRDLVVVDESWDERFYLILVDREQLTAEYVRFEPGSGTLTPVGAVFDRAAVTNATQAITVNYDDFEGQPLFARLTMPTERAERGPAVILVPWIQQSQATGRIWPAHFDHRNLNHFLAAQGYITVELLDSVELQSHPLLDLHITSDLLVGVHTYLVREGYAHTDRVCAVSWGPVAIASTLKYPDLFECHIVIGRTIDPRRVDELEYTLAEFAPEVDEPAPILVFAGNTTDRIGSFDISLMKRGRGKGMDQANDAEVIKYEDPDPFIRYGLSRVDMLTRIDRFLDANIGR